MVTEFCGFRHGVIGTDKMPADTTLNNMKKADLIKLLHTAQHNYESLMWFYNNAVKANMSQLNNNGWIPCSERLPEEYTDILGCDYEGNIYVMQLYKDSIFGNIWRQWNGGLLRLDVIIAWQPLPQPYQPKAGEK